MKINDFKDNFNKKVKMLFILQKSKGICKWDEIKVGKIYHMPPIGGASRDDILILSKDKYRITYEKLTHKDGLILTLYKTDVAVKFLSKAK